MTCMWYALAVCVVSVCMYVRVTGCLSVRARRVYASPTCLTLSWSGLPIKLAPGSGDTFYAYW